MDFKKSFCCGFNLSNDDIISGLCKHVMLRFVTTTRSENQCEKWHFWSKMGSGFWEPGWIPGGDLHMKGVGVFVGNFELNQGADLGVAQKIWWHPKWEQNLKFTPLSETTSIPTPFICGVPTPESQDVSCQHACIICLKYLPWHLNHLCVKIFLQWTFAPLKHVLKLTIHVKTWLDFYPLHYYEEDA